MLDTCRISSYHWYHLQRAPLHFTSKGAVSYCQAWRHPGATPSMLEAPPSTSPAQVVDTVVKPLEGFQASEPWDHTLSSSGKFSAANAEDTLPWVRIGKEWCMIPKAYPKGTFCQFECDQLLID